MKRSEILEQIELTLSDYLGEKINHPDHLADLILKTVETSGMLPPKSLDTVCVKKGLVRGYTQMFEWDDEELEKEIQKLKEQRNKYNSLAGAHSWRVEELEKENQELKAKLEKAITFIRSFKEDNEGYFNI